MLGQVRIRVRKIREENLLHVTAGQKKTKQNRRGNFTRLFNLQSDTVVQQVTQFAPI